MFRSMVLIVDSTSSEWNDDFANEYYELRKKGHDFRTSKRRYKNPLRLVL